MAGGRKQVGWQPGAQNGKRLETVADAIQGEAYPQTHFPFCILGSPFLIFQSHASCYLPAASRTASCHLRSAY